MVSFEAFDEAHNFEKQPLESGFPDYILQSVLPWIADVFKDRDFTHYYGHELILENDKLILPMSRQLRRRFSNQWSGFQKEITKDISTLTNVLSYILQNHAYYNDGIKLESILEVTGSAYSAEIISTKEDEFRTSYKMKLIHRVSEVVVEQAKAVLTNSELMQQAWDEHYSLNSDDEKTVTRATDALTGLLRDRYFPEEKRPMFGKIIEKIRKDPKKYPMPAEAIYERKNLLDLMLQFSKIRGNHKTGNGRAPTHEEAGFVLHFAIMLFQLMSVKSK